MTYDETGYNDYSSIFDDFEDAYSITEELAGVILSDNLQDRSTRAGFTRSGWQPKKDMKMQAIEWWEWGRFRSVSLVALIAFQIFVRAMLTELNV